MNRPPTSDPSPASGTSCVLEVCCGSADFAVAAARAGAGRVELCDNLVEGGTTPSLGAVALTVERCGVPVMAMIRPRGGDFLYSDLEMAVMLRDIEAIRDQGAFGVVFGVLRPDGTIDVERMTRLIDAARRGFEAGQANIRDIRKGLSQATYGRDGARRPMASLPGRMERKV